MSWHEIEICIEHFPRTGIVIYGQPFQESIDQPGMIANPARDQLSLRKQKSLSRSRLKIWLREEHVRPSRPASARYFSTLRLNLVLAHGISPAFQDDVYIVCRQPPLSQSRVNRVTHFHTDGVYSRDYAGTRSVILKVVRVTGAVFCLFRYHHGSNDARLSFPTPSDTESTVSTQRASAKSGIKNIEYEY